MHHPPLSPALSRRLTIFGGVILAFALLAGWSGFTTWNELSTLRRQFTSEQFESFRIAGELQAKMLGVNSSLRDYATTRTAGAWQRYGRESDELNAWIDFRRAELRTWSERRVFADIDAEYDRYLALAQTLRQERADPSDHSAPAAASALSQLDAAAGRIFDLAGRLSDAHRSALRVLLATSQRSLRRLEIVFGSGFLLLLGIGFWGTRTLFRETITPLRRQLVETQALAVQHEKLASLGVLAAGVAHEIRNPLTALKTRVFTLRKRVQANPPALADAEIIDREIDRLERIVGDFLIFARPGDPILAPLRPSEMLGEVRDLLAPELAASQITLTLEPPTEAVPTVQADHGQLKQVLLNLVRNAAESIGTDGRVLLRARRDRLSVQGRLQEVIVLEVQDSGGGIPPEVQERLFDPFFTTKPAGTGLGLSIAMRILERHGGTLQYQTARGAGTTFGVVLPGGGKVDG